jgi:hypothetical protein
MPQRSIALAAVLALTGGARAATDADLAAIRAQIDDMKKTYEQRIAALEKKLAQAEAQVEQVGNRAGESPAVRPAAGQSAFNPEISVILDGKYAATSRSPETYRLRGFVPSGGEIGPPGRSFSLGETELAISANVDHLFRGNVRFSVADEGGESHIETEEASVETLALPAGLKLKGGRFLSGIGYLNQQHPHGWDFVDAPLAYKAFWGSRLSQDGLQLKWVAPTALFFEVGGELARGGGFPGSERDRNGAGLGALFAHLGGDVGESHAWQAGVSYVRTHARERSWDDIDSSGLATANSFTGRSVTWGADFVWKWSPYGNSTRQNFKFQAEFFQRREDGSLSYDDSAGSNRVGEASDRFRSRQTGWYAQGVWQFMPLWRVGYRYDALDSGTLRLGLVDAGTLSAADFPSLAQYRPRRDSLMVDWSPSEFSRLRVQFARDDSRGPGETDKQFFLQYIMSLGAHGAHAF